MVKLKKEKDQVTWREPIHVKADFSAKIKSMELGMVHFKLWQETTDLESQLCLNFILFPTIFRNDPWALREVDVK